MPRAESRARFVPRIGRQTASPQLPTIAGPWVPHARAAVDIDLLVEIGPEPAVDARGLIASVNRWRELRLLRNAIAHDYLIESADRVLSESLVAAPELLDTVSRILRSVSDKGYA